MNKSTLVLAVVGLFGSVPASAASPWGASYFPNVELTTHHGKKVRFFDDLIKDKVVMINFIYTSCPDSCPLETARLAEVQRILGKRVGKDVFLYSITIDPENDTPEVLKQYRRRFRARRGWTFLTGKESDIIDLRKKLGLYLAEIQKEGSNNHNLSLIIGNQKTGRWMKRSPFENPYVLATQVGSWLHDWKTPTKGRGYASAPKLRPMSDGERLFRTRCAACHPIGGHVVGGAVATDLAKSTGPDLMGVTTRRDPEWLARWIKEPDKMLAEKDPIAMGLFAQFGEVPMPNMRLTNQEVGALIAFIDTESIRMERRRARGTRQSKGGLTVENAWIPEAHPESMVNAGYLTLRNATPKDLVLVGIDTPAFHHVELHEMSTENGMMRMQELKALKVPAGGETKLAPGGKHLMLKGPKSPLRRGQQVRVTLRFASGEAFTITLPVRKT